MLRAYTKEFYYSQRYIQFMSASALCRQGEYGKERSLSITGGEI